MLSRGARHFDELYAVLRDLKAGEINEDEAIQPLERSPFWVWTAMDPNSKLLLVIDVGTCTLAMAQRVVHQVVQRLAPGCIPLCLTDGLKDYGTAFLAHFGQWRQPARRRDKGPMPQPRWVSLPELLLVVTDSVEGLKWGLNAAPDCEMLGLNHEPHRRTSRRA